VAKKKQADAVQEAAPTLDGYVDGKREYAVIRDFVNKYSGKHCPIGSRVFLTDERAAVLTELGCVMLVPNRIGSPRVLPSGASTLAKLAKIDLDKMYTTDSDTGKRISVGEVIRNL
jgi:hypothetical protein